MSARKRRKIDIEGPTEECFGEIVSEVDLEIAIRRRVAETIESRISWALLLQDSLKKGSSGSTTSFKEVALDVASTIEAPLNVIFEREITHNVQSVPAHTARPFRPLPRHKPPRNPNGKFLYIRSSDLHPPYDDNHVQTYLLRCPECLRQSFTSLQGLLNHARISHGKEWGTHDECVRACAVVDPDLDVEMGTEVGSGPNGILPGIRSLFKMAVGVHQANDLMAGRDVETAVAGSRAENHSQSSNLTKTLGLHEDTPALAPFLGKEAVRRSIKVWVNEDDLIDVEGLDDDGKCPNGVQTSSVAEIVSSDLLRPWKMHFTHRNDFEPETEEGTTQKSTTNINPDLAISRETSLFNATEADKPEATDSRAEGPQNSLMETAGSRFYFQARISIMDRSLWVPPEKREMSSSGRTYKWMISVDAPSYSHHITTILKRLSVSSFFSPDEAPLTTTQPPFVVVGNANEPFLAKIELQFSGAPNSEGELTDQIVYLEHWVELDLSKSSVPVVGDEQMVDIDLDRGTVFLPLQKGYPPIGLKAQWSQTSSEVKQDNNQVVSRQDHLDILKNLVRKFPMTSKEAKPSRLQPQVPYRLVSISQFESFIPGRRKAIEWSRVRAIHSAYIQQIQGKPSQTQGLAPLTTADVYRWLSEEGHFIRPPGATKLKIEHPDIQPESNFNDVWCITCGQRIEAHLTSSAVTPSDSVRPELEKRSEYTAPETPLPCNIALKVLKMPMVNVFSRLSEDQSITRPEYGPNICMKDFHAVHSVAACDPKLILVVYDIVSALKLPTFTSGNSENLYHKFGKSRATIESHLAPHATLAIAVRCFVQSLVNRGIDLVKRQQPSRGLLQKGQDISEEMIPRCVLTPSHILSGVLAQRDASGPHSYPLGTAIFECLSKLGVPATPANVTTGPS
ncbi:hypothetical protein J132_10052 [Termitomyces sp. J132]|nr:hypothetical protein H2248_008537 [Termitomyces sp. 'cryptogamus']KNZ81774.1 hypothetical protein J132_10052 [Termitomyces sp. J132]